MAGYPLPYVKEVNAIPLRSTSIGTLIGRFHHFDTIPGKRLTKLDHIPFTAEDYRKLAEALDERDSYRNDLIKTLLPDYSTKKYGVYK